MLYNKKIVSITRARPLEGLNRASAVLCEPLAVIKPNYGS